MECPIECPRVPRLRPPRTRTKAPTFCESYLSASRRASISGGDDAWSLIQSESNDQVARWNRYHLFPVGEVANRRREDGSVGCESPQAIASGCIQSENDAFERAAEDQ